MTKLKIALGSISILVLVQNGLADSVSDLDQTSCNIYQNATKKKFHVDQQYHLYQQINYPPSQRELSDPFVAEFNAEVDQELALTKIDTKKFSAAQTRMSAKCHGLNGQKSEDCYIAQGKLKINSEPLKEFDRLPKEVMNLRKNLEKKSVEFFSRYIHDRGFEISSTETSFDSTTGGIIFHLIDKKTHQPIQVDSGFGAKINSKFLFHSVKGQSYPDTDIRDQLISVQILAPPGDGDMANPQRINYFIKDRNCKAQICLEASVGADVFYQERNQSCARVARSHSEQVYSAKHPSIPSIIGNTFKSWTSRVQGYFSGVAGSATSAH